MAALKAEGEGEGELCIIGSGDPIQALLPHDLNDEYLLMIHPIVLGSGRHLFPPGRPLTMLKLVGSETATSTSKPHHRAGLNPARTDG